MFQVPIDTEFTVLTANKPRNTELGEHLRIRRDPESHVWYWFS